ncbi:hypothetical protein VPH35_029959 [Triticum aestivum]
MWSITVLVSIVCQFAGGIRRSDRHSPAAALPGSNEAASHRSRIHLPPRHHLPAPAPAPDPPPTQFVPWTRKKLLSGFWWLGIIDMEMNNYVLRLFFWKRQVAMLYFYELSNLHTSKLLLAATSELRKFNGCCRACSEVCPSCRSVIFSVFCIFHLAEASCHLVELYKCIVITLLRP